MDHQMWTARSGPPGMDHQVDHQEELPRADHQQELSESAQSITHSGLNQVDSERLALYICFHTEDITVAPSPTRVTA